MFAFMSASSEVNCFASGLLTRWSAGTGHKPSNTERMPRSLNIRMRVQWQNSVPETICACRTWQTRRSPAPIRRPELLLVGPGLTLSRTPPCAHARSWQFPPFRNAPQNGCLWRDADRTALDASVRSSARSPNGQSVVGPIPVEAGKPMH